MKKASALFLSLMLVIAGIMTPPTLAQAADVIPAVESEQQTSENEARAQTEIGTYGVYLYKGEAIISESGSGKIAAGGNTTAKKVVSKITVGVRVQRKVDGSWYNYTTWSKTATDTAYVSTSKELTVPKGYYYRVYTTHSAATDSSTSSTGGIYID